MLYKNKNDPFRSRLLRKNEYYISVIEYPFKYGYISVLFYSLLRRKQGTPELCFMLCLFFVNCILLLIF